MEFHPHEHDLRRDTRRRRLDGLVGQARCVRRGFGADGHRDPQQC
jgi:hypothetical protein